MVVFKGKEYPLKELFVRQEAALAKQQRRLTTDDVEIQTDAMIEAIRVYTGMDIGDLNGTKFKDIMELFANIIDEYKKQFSPPVTEAAEEGNALPPVQ